MSGLEIEEITSRMKGMSKKEKENAIKCFDDDILLSELATRYRKMQDAICEINKTMQSYSAE